MNNTINSLREQIDLIDDEMTSLLVRRLNVCAEIAEEKRLSGAPVENLSREREVLARSKPGGRTIRGVRAAVFFLRYGHKQAVPDESAR